MQLCKFEKILVENCGFSIRLRLSSRNSKQNSYPYLMKNQKKIRVVKTSTFTTLMSVKNVEALRH